MSTLSNAIKTAVFTLLVPLVVAGVIPQRTVARDGSHLAEDWLARLLGGALVLLGTAGYFWCAALFVRAQGTPAPIAPPKSAVVSGPYKLNRNPMYTSVLAVVIGQALLYRSMRLALYGLGLFVCFHGFVILYEERSLRAKFDGEYENFCRRVPRWVPRLHR